MNQRVRGTRYFYAGCWKLFSKPAIYRLRNWEGAVVQHYSKYAHARSRQIFLRAPGGIPTGGIRFHHKHNAVGPPAEQYGTRFQPYRARMDHHIPEVVT